jgi:kynureninase
MNTKTHYSADFALLADKNDVLASFRNDFFFPQHNGYSALYFCGNSLGLQPKSVSDYLEQELKDWREFGVEGHFNSKRPWFSYHKVLTESLARLVGAIPLEVVAANTLTANLHFAMVSFYKPTPQRYKIIMEGNAFPSDQYAIESQVRYHGFHPDTTIIELFPREGEYTLRTEDILSAISLHGKELALVMFSGIQYLTGQRFSMQQIADAAHDVGAYCGLDLAHAIGNVELELHDWQIDFAVWCSYKYLNSGPGGIGGLFIHEKHAYSHDLPRFAGWWGYQESSRFLMKKGFIPEPGAQGWQVSNAQVFQMAALRASLDIFDKADLHVLFAKRDALTGYAEFMLHSLLQEYPHIPLEIITPKNTKERGAQLSMLIHKHGKQLIDSLLSDGIIVDWREPNIIRLAPAPLYNSFADITKFSEKFKEHCIRLFTTK